VQSVPTGCVKVMRGVGECERHEHVADGPPAGPIQHLMSIGIKLHFPFTFYRNERKTGVRGWRADFFGPWNHLDKQNSPRLKSTI
jgi:hypothetical protein